MPGERIKTEKQEIKSVFFLRFLQWNRIQDFFENKRVLLLEVLRSKELDGEEKGGSDFLPKIAYTSEEYSLFILLK